VRPLYTRTFWTACVLHFTGAMSFGMFLLFPLYVRHLGGDELTIGLLLGLGMASSVAARPLVGSLLDRLGRRKVLLGAGVANVVSYPPFLLLDGVGPGLYALAVFHLTIAGVLFASYFTYLADLAPADRRAEAVAIFGVAGMLPNGFGPALGEWLIADGGFGRYFAAATAFAAVSLLLTTLVPRARLGAHHVDTPSAGTVVGTMAHAATLPGLPRVLVASVIFGVAMNTAFYFVAPYTRTLGVEWATPFFATYAGATVAVRILGRRTLDRLGPRRVAVPAFALLGLGLGLLCYVPAPGTLVVAGLACGLGHGSLFPVLNALAVGRTPPRLHGMGVSLQTGALDLGATLGTPVCGAVAYLAGYAAMFTLVAAATGVGLVLMATDRQRL
jgi:MFS family permease